jgi:carbon-monoxide dehydrogenase catalytic subunit
MSVDAWCGMQSLKEVADGFHTKLITTSDRAKIEGVTHIGFSPENGLDIAKGILRMAIENYPNRRDKAYIPNHKQDIVTGFSPEQIDYLLGGSFRASYSF